MENKPLVSIIMPMYNCEKYVEQSILSVVEQTFPDWELIICDDGSKDGSLQIAKEYEKQDSRVHVIQNQVNSGVSVARNKALEIAKGKYICLLDSDDLYDKNYLEKQIAFIKEHGQFVMCSFRRLAPNSTTEYFVPKKATLRRILKGSCFTPLNVLIDRELIGDTRFDKDSEVEDFVFFCKLLKKTKYAYGNREVLASYRIVENSRSSNKKKLIGRMWRVYHKELGYNFFASLFYLFCWGVHGLFKYRNVR